MCGWKARATIDIDRFVDEKEIDRLYWNDPYFLVPDGKMAVEAYTVIREAMRKAGPHRARPRGDAHARAAAGHGAARQRHAGLFAAHP